MKAANILISNKGILQIADFGLARHYEGLTPQPGQGSGEAVRDYTSLVVTRWYRPPELLLTLKKYTPAIDMWGVGCVFGEMFERKPILEGKTDVDQCIRIFQLVGSPTEQNMPGWSDLAGCEGTREWEPQAGDIDKRFGPKLGSAEGLDLLKKLLCLDYRRRINAIDALQHPYFHMRPLPARPEDLPRYEDSHELDSRRRGNERQRALPPAPAGGTVGMGPDEWTGSGPPGVYGNGNGNGNANGNGNGNGYGYGDRGQPRGYGRDRGPPGVPPPRGYDDRNRGRPPIDAGPPGRVPAWRQDRDGRGLPPPPATNGHHLPPRPGDMVQRPEMPTRGPMAPARGGAGGGAGGGGGAGASNVDTYIPSYSSANPADRPPSRPEHDARGRRGSYESAYRDSDAPPPRERYRDPDAAPASRERGPYRDPDMPYHDRNRERERGGYGGEQRRTRSRSPDRERGQRESDARRERLQNRERDLYRR